MDAPPTYTKTFHRTTYPSISPTRPELSLAGKTALITGAGSGIGAAIAHTYAAAGAANLLLMGRTAARLEAVKQSIAAAHPSTAVALFAGDITSAGDVAAAFAHLRAAFGAATTLDALVANAGHLPAPAPLATADPDDWWRAYEVNVKGVFLLAQHFVRCAAPGAVFVNTSTMAAHVGCAPAFSGYVGSKVGAAKVVEGLQGEVPGLRFVNVHPGVVETGMFVKSGMRLECNDPDLSSHFFLWLISPEADFLKGKFVWVNWDVDELMARKEEITSGDALTVGLLKWA